MSKPLNDRETLGLILNRCGESLEELWLQNLEIDEKLVEQMAETMKQLKHLKLSLCQIDELAMDSIAYLFGGSATVDFISNLFGHQLYSFVLDETAYPANIWELIYKDSSKLEHLGLNSHNHSVVTIPIKLPYNLISFSLYNKFYGTTLMVLSNAAKDCQNLKMLQLEIPAIMTDMIAALGNIKSLVYLNLVVNSIQNENAFKNVICHELPNLKAFNIRGYCSEVLIFSKIDDFSQKIELENVCRHWRQIIPLYWKTTKICPVPLDNLLTLDLVLNRCGKNMEELWLQNLEIGQKLVKQIAEIMKQLKHMKLSKCKLDGPAMDSISDSFGKQLYSFILDETSYHPSMRRLLENESSNLEHLSLNLSRNFFAEALPNKLPSNLKSFSLCNKFYGDSSNLILLSNLARDCNNLKVLHLEIRTLCSEISMAIGNIKSLVYLNLEVKSIENEDELKHVLCHELPNLKAIKIGGYCNEETVSFICNARPDLVHLNVFARQAFQISDSLNSLTLRIPSTVNFVQFFPFLLIIKKNESIQHLDIRSIILPSYGNFIEELLGQFPNLKALHCKMPTTNAEFNSIFCLFEKHLKKGRKINIYFHFAYEHALYYKFILPDDLPLFSAAGWKPKIWSGKCENFMLKKLIKEAIGGRNEPTFLDEWWME